MAKLTGNTVGSLKKMWPPIKKKASENHPSFGAFLGTPAPTGGETKVAVLKPAGGKKRKAGDQDIDEETKAKDPEPDSAGAKSDNNNKSTTKKKPAAKPRTKKIKKEDTAAEVKDETKKSSAEKEDNNSGEAPTVTQETEQY